MPAASTSSRHACVPSRRRHPDRRRAGRRDRRYHRLRAPQAAGELPRGSCLRRSRRGRAGGSVTARPSAPHGPFRDCSSSRRSRRSPAREQDLVIGEVLAEDGLYERIVKAHRTQPEPVHGQPCRSGMLVDDAAAQQQLADAMPRAHQITTQVLPRPDEVAQALSSRLGMTTSRAVRSSATGCGPGRRSPSRRCGC